MNTVVRSLKLFISLLTVVVLFSSVLLADTKSVPTTSHDSWLDAINTPAAWIKGYTGTGVSVGIVDDSIDTNQPYYKDQISKSYNTGAYYNDITYMGFSLYTVRNGWLWCNAKYTSCG